MNIKYYLLLFIFSTLSVAGHSQEARINWMTWEQAVEKSKTTHQKIFIHIFTDGCAPCKKMDATTFETPNVINLINENFYPVKLDARSRKDLGFNGKKLEYKCDNYGLCYHELAMELTNGSLSFPSVVFLDETLNTIGSIPDYKDPKQFALYVEYYAHGHSKKMTFHRFVEYKKKFKTGN